MTPVRTRTIEPADFDELNRIFSDAFTQAYQRDGLPGIRIPPLHPTFLKLERELAEDGAIAIESNGRLAGFVLARAHGADGWFGPLAVAPKLQGEGLGKELVRRAIAHLMERRCSTIGLETMPRTYRNLGLYTKLGFRPGHLVMTCQVQIPAEVPKVPGEPPAFLLSTLVEAQREQIWPSLVELWNRICPGVDYTKPMQATLDAHYGDVLLTLDGDRITGFLHFHHSPYFLTDGTGVLRIARVGALRDTTAFPRLMSALAEYGQVHGMEELYIRCQSDDWNTAKQIFGWGFRITHTDLRMSLETHPERVSPDTIFFTRWG